MRLKELLSLIQISLNKKIETYVTQLKMLNEKMLLLSPQSTLVRGYSIVTNKHGKTIRDSKKVDIGESINIKLSQGGLISEVKEKLNNG